MGKKGLLLVNLGTPRSPKTPDVRAYLREFLMDPYVVDISWFARWFLVHGLILPTRPRRSAAAYAKIWTARGSPLLFHLEDLATRVRELLGPEWVVEPAMRYGEPSIERGLTRLRDAGVRDVTVFPLYPQFSLAATESSIRACHEAVRKLDSGFRLQFVPEFYSAPEFLDSFAEVASPHLVAARADHVLMSFHGLPERQIRSAVGPGAAHCLADASCCENPGPALAKCYRAQCFVTARGLAARLGLGADQYTVTFQSRLGQTAWIKPYTDAMYVALATRGVRRLAVLCPAFVSDCLETLEEIAIRGREEFIELGGEEVTLVPSLNSHESWAKGVVALALRTAQKRGEVA